MRLDAAPPDAALLEANRARGDGLRRGWYEVYYATCALPDRRAVWLRWTLHCPRRGRPSAALWGCAFDRRRPRWFAARAEHAADAWRPLRAGVSVGGSRLEAGSSSGEIADAAGRRLRWELALEPRAQPLEVFWGPLERIAFAATYPIVAVPLARAHGFVEVDGERIEVSDAAAQQSHLFGGRHAERWGWVHALGFDEDRDGHLVLVWARPNRLGGRLAAVSSLALRAGGLSLRAGGAGAAGGVRWEDGGGETVRFAARAGAARIEGEIHAPRPALTGVTYLDPDGSAVHCANTEVADCHVRVTRARQTRELTCRAACGFERGGRRPMARIWRPL